MFWYILLTLYVVSVIVMAVCVLVSNYRDEKEKKAEAEKEVSDYYREKPWNPTFRLEHHGVVVFNLPFVPADDEVIYIENEYCEEENRFVRENYELICTMFADAGWRFIYLPYLNVGREQLERMLAYRCPNTDIYLPDDVVETGGLESSFLLNYMLYKSNRSKVTPGFAWHNKLKTCLFMQKKELHVYDFITFNAAEAHANPAALLSEIIQGLGNDSLWEQGAACRRKMTNDSADDLFNEEIREILENVRKQLSEVRMRGISEALIERYVSNVKPLSRMTITHDLRIILEDYDGVEVKMEPLVKSVYLLFLRHPEGILFKNLPDYAIELECIYRAVRSRINDIDKRMSQPLPPIISKSIESLTNPMDNSINEKCARIKEVFVRLFHEMAMDDYTIKGARGCAKRIALSRSLVKWDESRK